MKILDRLPIFEREEADLSSDGIVTIKAFQIAVSVSLTIKGIAELDPGTPIFPAILDTGNSHNFAIREDQLEGAKLSHISRIGSIRLGGDVLPLIAANVWLHRNRPNTRMLEGGAYLLELSEGVAVYPQGMPNPARLPILGLRGLVKNNLTLLIDGKQRAVTLKL